MTTLVRDRDLRRWAISAALVVLAHGAVAGAMLRSRADIEPDEPASVIVVEFAPLPVAPASEPSELPPGPQQEMSDASPDQPVEAVKQARVQPEQPVETPAEVQPPEAPNPDMVVRPPTPEVSKQAPQRQEPRAPAPTTAAPQASSVPVAPIAAAPVQAQSRRKHSNAVPNWASKVAALLERNKRFPAEALAHREEGVAEVFFSLDRSGRLVESRLVRSSGAATLDQEALALLHRSQPYPPPPPELDGPQVHLTVPIRFNLK